MEDIPNNNENFERLKQRLYGGFNINLQDKKKMLEALDERLKEQEKKEELEEKARLRLFDSLIEKHLTSKIDLKSELIMNFEPFQNFSQTSKVGTIKYTFSDSLKFDRYNRLDFSDWMYSANFLINNCNIHCLDKSEEEQKKEILKGEYFNTIIQTLHRKPITPQTFVDIINGNKPFFSIGLNNYLFCRKNLLFMSLYIQKVKQIDKSVDSKIEHLARHWIRAILNYKSFSNFKGCIFLNRDYKKSIASNKLSTIKYFNDIVLGEIEVLLNEQSLDSTWIKSIRSTYLRLYGKEYEACNAERIIIFPLFSKEELEMFVYILNYNISVSETFPFSFENLINEVLINEGVSPLILEELVRELSNLDTH